MPHLKNLKNHCQRGFRLGVQQATGNVPEEVQAQALGAEAVPTQLDQHGQRYQVDLEVDGVEGQKAIVRTGWIVEPKANFARLVTLYVRKQP